MSLLLAFALFHEPMPIDAYWLGLLRHLLLTSTSTHFKPERALPVWIGGAVANIVLAALVMAEAPQNVEKRPKHSDSLGGPV